MSDTSFETPEPPPDPIMPAAANQPEHEDHLKHAKSSVIHVVEHLMDKVTDTFGNIGGRR